MNDYDGLSTPGDAERSCYCCGAELDAENMTDMCEACEERERCACGERLELVAGGGRGSLDVFGCEACATGRKALALLGVGYGEHKMDVPPEGWHVCGMSDEELSFHRQRARDLEAMAEAEDRPAPPTWDAEGRL